MWFQGGMGMSTARAIFLYNGPFFVKNEAETLTYREYSFVTNHSVIYMDNPVGAGFSFTDNYLGYPTSQERYGRDIITFLSQFFQIFFDFRKNEFFVGGDSYGGKYAIIAAHEINNLNSLHDDRTINLKGIFIGNGLIDYAYQDFRADYLYTLGLLDEYQHGQMKGVEQKRSEWRKIYYSSDRAISEWARTNLPGPSEVPDSLELFSNFTGIDQVPNILDDASHTDLIENRKWMSWIEKPETRKALHVGNLSFTARESTVLVRNLAEDREVSVAPIFAKLLENYRVLLMNGQLDMIFPYQSTMKLIRSLKWSGSEEFKYASRRIWRIDGKVVGYWRSAGNLVEVLVRKAGHVVSYDRFPWACKLLLSLTRNDYSLLS